jgi:hypothetical protein
MPSPVDKYFKSVKDKNPSYSDEQAWATAWSIFCRNNPGSSHCHKPADEYLSKEARLVTEFADALLVQKVASRFLVAMSTPEDVSKLRTMVASTYLVPVNPHEHYLVKCSSCGSILNQCRCTGPKTIILATCDRCKDQANGSVP